MTRSHPSWWRSAIAIAAALALVVAFLRIAESNDPPPGAEALPTVLDGASSATDPDVATSDPSEPGATDGSAGAPDAAAPTPGGAAGPSAAPLGGAAGGGGGSRPCPPIDDEVSGVPEVANPFDPGQADVSVEFAGPGDRHLTVAAFVYRNYARSLNGLVEGLSGEPRLSWRVRFAPPVGGTWQARTHITTNGTTTVGAWRSFSCSSDPNRHGPLRVSPDDHRYLRYDDGSPFVGIGENLAWPESRGTYAYDDWVNQLATHGATVIRVWMSDWSFGVEGAVRDAQGTITGMALGDYRAKLDKAWQLDYVIELARQKGMLVVVSLQNHGAFSTFADPRWNDNPYNAARGGPIAQPHDFFTDPRARDLFKRRLRYIVARWGYQPNIMWELFNEVDLTDAEPMADVVAWHVEMADELHRIDPQRHLVTTSGTGGMVDAISRLPQIDVVQVHPYGDGTDHPMDFAHDVIGWLKAMSYLDKPVFVGETGVDFHGPEQTLRLDPEYQGMREAIWTGLFAGQPIAGLPWWWDSLIGKYHRYDLFLGLSALTRDVAMDREHFALDGAVASSPGHKVQVLPLRGRTTVLAWVRTGGDWWFKPDNALIENGQVQFTRLANGRWRVRFVDTHSGQVTEVGHVDVTVGSATIELPPFTHDLAVRLDKA